jgi:hypothetical protein
MAVCGPITGAAAARAPAGVDTMSAMKKYFIRVNS